MSATVVEEPTKRDLPTDHMRGPFHLVKKIVEDGSSLCWCGVRACGGQTVPGAEIPEEAWCKPCLAAWRRRFNGWRGLLYAVKGGK